MKQNFKKPQQEIPQEAIELAVQTYFDSEYFNTPTSFHPHTEVLAELHKQQTLAAVKRSITTGEIPNGSDLHAIYHISQTLKVNGFPTSINFPQNNTSGTTYLETDFDPSQANTTPDDDPEINTEDSPEQSTTILQKMRQFFHEKFKKWLLVSATGLALGGAGILATKNCSDNHKHSNKIEIPERTKTNVTIDPNINIIKQYQNAIPSLAATLSSQLIKAAETLDENNPSEAKLQKELIAFNPINYYIKLESEFINHPEILQKIITTEVPRFAFGNFQKINGTASQEHHLIILNKLAPDIQTTIAHELNHIILEGNPNDKPFVLNEGGTEYFAREILETPESRSYEKITFRAFLLDLFFESFKKAYSLEDEKPLEEALDQICNAKDHLEAKDHLQQFIKNFANEPLFSSIMTLEKNATNARMIAILTIVAAKENLLTPEYQKSITEKYITPYWHSLPSDLKQAFEDPQNPQATDFLTPYLSPLSDEERKAYEEALSELDNVEIHELSEETSRLWKIVESQWGPIAITTFITLILLALFILKNQITNIQVCDFHENLKSIIIEKLNADPNFKKILQDLFEKNTNPGNEVSRDTEESKALIINKLIEKLYEEIPTEKLDETISNKGVLLILPISICALALNLYPQMTPATFTATITIVICSVLNFIYTIHKTIHARSKLFEETRDKAIACITPPEEAPTITKKELIKPPNEAENAKRKLELEKIDLEIDLEAKETVTSYTKHANDLYIVTVTIKTAAGEEEQKVIAAPGPYYSGALPLRFFDRSKYELMEASTSGNYTELTFKEKKSGREIRVYEDNTEDLEMIPCPLNEWIKTTNYMKKKLDIPRSDYLFQIALILPDGLILTFFEPDQDLSRKPGHWAILMTDDYTGNVPKMFNNPYKYALTGIDLTTKMLTITEKATGKEERLFIQTPELASSQKTPTPWITESVKAHEWEESPTKFKFNIVKPGKGRYPRIKAETPQPTAGKITPNRLITNLFRATKDSTIQNHRLEGDFHKFANRTDVVRKFREIRESHTKDSLWELAEAVIAKSKHKGHTIQRKNGYRPSSEGVFREHREYTPGDDTRDIDWRTSAKRDHTGLSTGLVVKHYEDRPKSTPRSIITSIDSMVSTKAFKDLFRTLVYAIMNKTKDPINTLYLTDESGKIKKRYNLKNLTLKDLYRFFNDICDFVEEHLLTADLRIRFFQKEGYTTITGLNTLHQKEYDEDFNIRNPNPYPIISYDLSLTFPLGNVENVQLPAPLKRHAIKIGFYSSY